MEKNRIRAVVFTQCYFKGQTGCWFGDKEKTVAYTPIFDNLYGLFRWNIDRNRLFKEERDETGVYWAISESDLKELQSEKI